jgi:flagella basal body P-ring formation protein FlgA
MIRLLVILVSWAVSGGAQAHAVADGTVNIRLKEHVEIQATQLALSDVAVVIGGEAALANKIATLDLGAAPRVGATRRLERAALERLAARAVNGKIRIAWAGASRVVVTRRAQHRDGSVLAAKAGEYLLAELQHRYPDGTRIEVNPVGTSASLTLPAGTVAMAPRAVGAREVAKRMCVWLDVAVDGEFQRSIPVWLNVSVYRASVVARRALDAGEVVSLNDFSFSETDVTRVHGEPLMSDAALHRQRMRRRVSAGGVISARDIEPLPPVVRNQEVTVKVASGAVFIEAPGIAEEDGAIGDTILVRNPKSDSAFRAEIVAQGTVFVTAR